VFDNASGLLRALAVLVEESAFDRFTALFEEHVRAIRVGDPLDRRARWPPDLRCQRDAVASFSTTAILSSAVAARPKAGFWFAPTILAPQSRDAE